MTPGINHHELPDLLTAATGVGTGFEDWLGQHCPDRREKVLNCIRSMRDGALNDPRFGSRMRRVGVFAEHIAQFFSTSCYRTGIEGGSFPKLSTDAFRRDGGAQPELFG